MEPTQEMANVSNTAGSRSGQVRSVLTVPLLLTSPQIPLGVTHIKGSEFSSVRNSQEQGKAKHLSKDQRKEQSTGTRLLNVSGDPRGGACPLPDLLGG